MAAPLIGAAAIAAAKLVARKMAKDTAKKSVKKAIKTAKKSKPLAEPKSAVRVKPAAKQIGNPYNYTKSWEQVLSSVSRGGVGSTTGKARDARVLMSSKAVSSKKPSRPVVSPSNPDFRPRVKINSAPKKTTAKKKSK